ncbi:AraC family transcriptional regulator [Rhizobium sp.]
MDPLSDVLSLLKPRNYMSAGLDAAGDWLVQFPDQAGNIKCGAVVSGQCWLSMEGVGEAVLLGPGDSFLLPNSGPFRMGSDLGLEAMPASSIFSKARMGGMTVLGGGGDCEIVSSRFRIEGGQAGNLLGMLPPIVHIRDSSSQAALRWPVERMMQELREGAPGNALIIEHLAHMIMVQALRLHLAQGPKDGSGWLFALADRQIGAAIGAMHAEPARRWTVQTLAAISGMSRSSFALRFKSLVGSGPLDYLSRWRMLLAGDRLVHSGDPVSVIALSLGYESESAFSTAFKRITGYAPRSYAQRGKTEGIIAAENTESPVSVERAAA